MTAEKTETTFTLCYRVTIPIRATPQTIWAKLTDAKAFPSWNSTVASIDGEIALGNKLALKVPAAPGRTFTPKVVEFVPERSMVWRDGFAPMFQGTRSFTLKAGTDGCTEFEMVEVLKGLMLPMAKSSLPDFRSVFDQYAADLKKACESA